ncbi:MAG: agglutination protein [Sulfurimonas sp.]|nr:MAG: agglutination protein [Sulfurimonas sp.]
MTKIMIFISIVSSLVNALSIDEAVRQTIETNPQIEVKKEELRTEQEVLVGSRSAYLPKVDISYSAGPERTHTVANKRSDTANGSDLGGKEDNLYQNASLRVTQNIFEGLRTMYTVEQQKTVILSADIGVKNSANSIALETVTTYIDILRNKEFYDIAKDNMEVHKKYLAQIKETIDAGIGRSSGYKQTLSRYENAQSSYFLAQQTYKNSIATFQRILPVSANAEELIKPTIGILPADNLEDLISIGVENNPSIQISKADIKYAESSLNRSYAAYYPRLDLEANAYWNKGLTGLRGTPTDADGANVLLVLSYNIFNGLADKSLQEANEHKLLRQNSSLSDAKRYIKAYTTVAWQTYNITKTRLVHINNNIKASADTIANYKEEYNLGRRSLVDLLNIELEYNNARNRKVAAEYDRLLAYYQILTHTGKILETMNVTIEN